MWSNLAIGIGKIQYRSTSSLYPRTVTRKTMSKEIGIEVYLNSPELSMGHVELGLLFLQLAQVVILLIIYCTKNGLQTMIKTVP